MEVLASAFRHGVEADDIEHVLRTPWWLRKSRTIRLAIWSWPDRAANLLELVVLDRPQGPAVIHAMAMRQQYRRLLPKEQ